MDNSENDPELQEAIRRSLNEDNHISSSSNPVHHNQGPIGFEHLEANDGNDVGFEHLNREESSTIRHRSHGNSEGRSGQLSTEQLRAARLARFERNNN